MPITLNHYRVKSPGGQDLVACAASAAEAAAHGEVVAKLTRQEADQVGVPVIMQQGQVWPLPGAPAGRKGTS